LCLEKGVLGAKTESKRSNGALTGRNDVK